MVFDCGSKSDRCTPNTFGDSNHKPVKHSVSQLTHCVLSDFLQDEIGSGSFPKQFGYDDQEAAREENSDFSNDFLQSKSKNPRLYIMGLRRSGKSSIQKVIFNKMSPNETLFLESTNRISKDEISTSSFVSFSIWNFPGQMDSFDQNFSDDIFSGISGALVFVIDAQDDYTDALSNLLNVIQRVYKLNQNIIFEVFIHKVDCVSDDNKFEIQRDIYQRVKDELIDADLEFVKISYHLTSIYDHSIFEAFSKVVQKLIPQLDSLEHLLNLFISVSVLFSLRVVMRNSLS